MRHDSNDDHDDGGDCSSSMSHDPSVHDRLLRSKIVRLLLATNRAAAISCNSVSSRNTIRILQAAQTFPKRVDILLRRIHTCMSITRRIYAREGGVSCRAYLALEGRMDGPFCLRAAAAALVLVQLCAPVRCAPQRLATP